CLVSRYGMEVQPDLIWELISVRQHLELAFWQEAVVRLSHKEIDYLADLIEKAEKKIQNQPVVIPLEEHSEFHLSIYRPLNNTFLNGILETYWQLSQETEFRMYSDQVYLENVWTYHKKIQRAIATKEYDLGYQALMTHFELVRTQKKAEITQRFE
ncbi:MAG: FCD domain-containing protein, partial [Anaerolineaceae bacterium]|nr:FCD domain-containing protein [Anaerolineaceae bacterium]